jgi:hypothetical protein
MAFVKLDTGILDSTLWLQKDQRDIFITALLMAKPEEFDAPIPQLEVDALKETGFMVPPGWYGFVPASGPGIVRRAMVEPDAGLKALRQLGEPESESRSQEYDGRRMARVNGGYIVLNYMRFRDYDHGAADRMRKLRERRKEDDVRRNGVTVPPNVTHSRGRKQRADAEGNNGSAPPTQPVNPDSGVEIALATWFYEELGVPADFGTRDVTAQAFRALAKEGGDLKMAADFILQAAKQAKQDGETINRFWITDQRYLPKEKKKKKADPLEKMKFVNK